MYTIVLRTAILCACALLYSVSVLPVNDAKSSCCVQLREYKFEPDPRLTEFSPECVVVWVDQQRKLLYVTLKCHQDQPVKSAGWYTSKNGGRTWQAASKIPALSGETDWGPHPSDPLVRYRGVVEPTENAYIDEWFVERTSDGGKHWTRLRASINGSLEKVGHVTKLVYHPKDVNWIYVSAPVPLTRVPSTVFETSKFGIYTSTDGGQNFRLLLMNDSSEFAVSKSQPNVIFAKVFGGSIAKSEDSGTSWRLVEQNDAIRHLHGLGAGSSSKADENRKSENSIHNILIDPNDAKVVYVLSRKGILKTSDGGNSWCVLELGPSSITSAVGSMALDPNEPHTILVGTYAGLYWSRDGGCSWERVNVRKLVTR